MMDFSQINKVSAKSFNQQKQLIKRLGMGQQIQCPECGQCLQLKVPGKQEQVCSQKYGIYCKRRCTDIELEFD